MAQPARERVYDYMKGEIASGRFPLGEFVTETEIANEVGVSRTPVREALHLLEQSGFVRIIPKKGVYIPHISPQEIEDLWEARRLIETYAVRRIVAKLNATFFDDARDMLTMQKEAAEAGDQDAFIGHDRGFHQHFIEAAGNSVITGFYEGLRDRQLRMGVQAVVLNPGRFEAVLTEHQAIVDALEDGDEDATVAAVCEHLDATRAATAPWRRA